MIVEYKSVIILMSKGAEKFTDKNTKSEYTYIHGVQL